MTRSRTDSIGEVTTEMGTRGSISKDGNQQAKPSVDTGDQGKSEIVVLLRSIDEKLTIIARALREMNMRG